ncbi:MAG: hypothetical protein DRP46_05490, partial [Candidatus Zixiibacteriota bacterium]
SFRCFQYLLKECGNDPLLQALFRNFSRNNNIQFYRKEVTLADIIAIIFCYIRTCNKKVLNMFHISIIWGKLDKKRNQVCTRFL